MKTPVVVYTTQYCPHCHRAKELLRRKKINFQEIDLTNDSKKRQEAEEQYGWMSVPIVVIGDKCIGGSNELYELERKGGLDKLV